MVEKLRLYYPVTPFTLNQRFGENIPCVKDFGLPNQTIISGTDNNTCPAGFDKLYPHFGMPGHNGVDLMVGEQNVYAACDGVVIEKQTVPARGLGLGILTNNEVDFGYGVAYAKVRYWHLKSFYCEVGDSVKAGQLIGVSDNTGYSAANHLHFEVDPMTKDSGGHPVYTTLPTTLIAGSVDPEPFFTGIAAVDIPKVTSLYTALIPLLTNLITALKARGVHNSVASS